MAKKIKVGLVGMGRLLHFLGGAGGCAKLPELFEVVAVADQDKGRRENIREEYGNPKRFATLDELLKKSDAEIIGIATRHPDHVPMAIQCLENGRHVYLEKPCACSVKELQTLKKVMDKTGKKVFFGHLRRFEGGFSKVRDLIARGEIGNVQYVKIDRSVGFCRRNDWMTMPEYYGGLLTNWGPHIIDQALTFLESPVVDMWADVRNVVSIGEGDDLFKIVLKGKNGRVVDVQVTGANVLPAARELEVIGDRGSIAYPVDKKIFVRRIDPSVTLKKLKPHPENPPIDRYGNFDEQLYFVESKYDEPAFDICAIIWQYVYDTLVHKKPFPITYEQAMEVVKVTEKAFELSKFTPIKKFKSKVKSK